LIGHGRDGWRTGYKLTLRAGDSVVEPLDAAPASGRPI
jgi:hypothetical protein